MCRLAGLKSVSRPHCVMAGRPRTVRPEPGTHSWHRAYVVRSLDRMLFSRATAQLVDAEQALRGRDHYEFEVPATHFVSGRPIKPPFPDGLQQVVFGAGCFWGVEEIFWDEPGVWTTAVGYTGGYTPHPDYEEVCSGRTGHTEAVLVVFDPEQTTFAAIVARFFEVHDPTQGFRQATTPARSTAPGSTTSTTSRRPSPSERRSSSGRNWPRAATAPSPPR